MKRVLLAIVSTVATLVMLLSFKTHGTAVTTPAAAVSSTGSSGGTTASSGSSGSGGSGGNGGSAGTGSSGSSSAKTSHSAAATYTGAAVDTQYGPVQVQITVKNGAVTAVSAVEYPNSDPRDAQINSYAIPALDSEAKAASSASIDTISGATYTSEGYISSLQSAIDKAGL